MEMLYTHLADRKRFAEADFVARVGVPLLLYRPGKSDSLLRMRTHTFIREVPNAEWNQIKNQVREEATQYRVVRLGLPSEVRDRVIRMGRATQNEVVLNHQSVSKQHAAVHVRHDGIFIADLGSKNGTRVDQTPVGSELVRLKPPAKIVLGDIDLRCLDPKSFFAFLSELLL